MAIVAGRSEQALLGELERYEKDFTIRLAGSGKKRYTGRHTVDRPTNTLSLYVLTLSEQARPGGDR